MKQARKDHTEQGRGTVETELRNGRVAEETIEESNEAIKAPREANPIGTVTRQKIKWTHTSSFKQGAKPDIAAIAESKRTSE